MRELSAGKLSVKKSIFFGHLYHIENKNEIKEIINLHKKLYKKANHHCYALIFKEKSGFNISTFKNDGEVGFPGKILLELLKKYDLNSNVIFVTRIFGGIKLGVGGVSKSFRDVGESLIRYHISK